MACNPAASQGLEGGQPAEASSRPGQPDDSSVLGEEVSARLRPVARWSNLAWLAVGVLLWLSLMAFPEVPAEINIDPSWQQALAHAAKNHMQAGVDYVFTYGPLGIFMNSMVCGSGRFFVMHYDPDLFALQVVWEIVINLGLAAVFIAVSLRLRIMERVIFFILVTVTLPISKDALYLFSVVAVTVLIIENGLRHRMMTRLGLLFLAATALTKFTLFTTAFVCVACVAALMLSKRHWRAAAAVAAIYVAFVICVWALAGQRIANLPTYLSNSIEIAGGHSEAMARPDSMSEVILALGIVAVTAGICVLSSLAKPLNKGRLTAAVVVALGFAAAWKAGFTRHDLHAFVFYSFAAVALFALRGPASKGRLLRSVFVAGRLLAVAAAVVGLLMVARWIKYGPGDFVGRWRHRLTANVSVLRNPSGSKQALQEQLEALRRKHALPRIRETVKDATVDFFSANLGVLLANDLNWHPRPVFQSYLAYTPKLIEANADFYESAEAPEFVVFKLRPIDYRFPTMEDCEALNIVLRNYALLLVENEHLLLKRPPIPPTLEPPQRRTLLEGKAGFFERVGLDGLEGDCQLLSIDIDGSLLGALRKTFYRAPSVFIDVTTSAGAIERYRIVPSMIRSGFILNPLIREPADLIRWYSGEPLSRVESFAIVVAPGHEKYFRPGILYSVSAVDIAPHSGLAETP